MKKLLFILGILTLIVSITGATYAYWDNLSANKNEEINIGEGTSITVNAVAVAPDGKTLIPAGVLMGVNDVDSVVLTYNVKLTKESANAPSLTVTASDVKIGSETAYSNLVNIAISPETTAINNTDVLVTVTVTLSEPGDIAAYNAISKKAITFNLTFSAA